MIAFILYFDLTTNTNIIEDRLKQKTLEAISIVESQNNSKAKHSVIKKGVHKGHFALGKFGLMPNTIKDIIKKDRLLSLTHSYVLKYNQVQLKDLMENDVLFEYEIASKLYDRLKNKYKTLDKISYSWLNGSVKNIPVKNHWYVKRVEKQFKRSIL